MLRYLEKYEIFLWLKYFWSYKQIFSLPSFLNTLYMYTFEVYLLIVHSGTNQRVISQSTTIGRMVNIMWIHGRRSIISLSPY